jgi:hypothetical protein
VVAYVLRHLQHQPDLVVRHLQGGQDGGQLALKVHIHDGTNNLQAGGAAEGSGGGGRGLVLAGAGEGWESAWRPSSPGMAP